MMPVCGVRGIPMRQIIPRIPLTLCPNLPEPTRDLGIIGQMALEIKIGRCGEGVTPTGKKKLMRKVAAGMNMEELLKMETAIRSRL